jgi:hypothetical protein
MNRPGHGRTAGRVGGTARAWSAGGDKGVGRQEGGQAGERPDTLAGGRGACSFVVVYRRAGGATHQAGRRCVGPPCPPP